MPKTASAGEISVLDPAALDAGGSAASTLTITKPITIDGGAGRVAGFGAVSLGDSIVINSAVPGAVVLRHLRLNGFAGMGANGIRVSSSTNVVLDHIDIAGYAQNCLVIDASASGALVDTSYSVFSNCKTGVSNQAAAIVNLGDETSVVMNTVAGVSSNNPLGEVYFFNSVARSNAQNTNFSSYASGSSATLSGGGVGCGISSQQFVPPASIGSPLPALATAAAAGFQFSTNDCGAGASVVVSVTYAQALPANAVLYKYGPATAGAGSSSWFALPGAVLSGDRKTFTYTLIDNGVGDSNSALGFIDDPVLPVVLLAAETAQAIPSLSEWGVLLLTILLLLAALRNFPPLTLVSRRFRA